jgi:hypothetical protein
MQKCQATTKNGLPCRMNAITDSDYCHVHQIKLCQFCGSEIKETGVCHECETDISLKPDYYEILQTNSFPITKFNDIHSKTCNDCNHYNGGECLYHKKTITDYMYYNPCLQMNYDLSLKVFLLSD